MNESLIKVLLLQNQEILIAEIEEVGTELGEPDCKLVNPFKIKESPIDGFGYTLEPWMAYYTSQNTFMIHSDKIITIADPKGAMIDKYKDLVK